jgi:anaerobic selenocysteine-containing dehydrogenase
MPKLDSDDIFYRTCPLCEATCGLEIHVRDGVVSKIRGDREDVFSGGFVCPKGATLKHLHEDPDRLRSPRIRGEDGWREASWDEAFAEIARGLGPIIEESGRDAIAVYLGNPNVHNMAGSLYARPLLKSLGTRNVFSASTVDQMPRHVSSGLLFGSGGLMPVPDLDRTHYLLMLGANPLESNGSLCTAPDFPGRLAALQKRGGRLVVVDPRATRTAQKADLHLSIRPGTDVYFLLALAQVIQQEDLVSLERLEEWIDGPDTLRDLRDLLSVYTPERIAPITGIDADTTRRIARELAAAESAAVYGRMGAHTVEFGTLTSWAADLINILTGNLDRAGGVMFPNAAHSRPIPEGAKPGGRGYPRARWHSRVRGLPEAQGELPVAVLAEEIETPGDGQIRALLTIGGNPALSTPNSDRLDAALGSLDFMVSVDPYLNETTRHANVILPPPSPLERSHYDLAFYGISVRNVANYSEAIFEASGPPESDILARLALIAQGQGADADPAIVDDLMLDGLIQIAIADEDAPLATRDPAELRAAVADGVATDRLLDVMLRTGPFGDGFGANPDGLSLDRLRENPHGIDLGALEPRLPRILRTPSGRIELAPPPIRDELARLEAALDRPPREGLLLIGRRHVRSNNSWMHNILPLVSGRPRCTLQVNPKDASLLKLESGDTARVSSRAGSLDAPVEVTADVMEGVVSLPHGWGHDRPDTEMRVAQQHAGVNSNRLTDEAIVDGLSGNAILNGIPVTVERRPEAAAE